MIGKYLIPVIFFVLTLSFCGIENNKSTWTKDQIGYHETFIKFCTYVDNKKLADIPIDTLFKNYIYFDYVLNDSSLERKERRIEMFPSVLQSLQHCVDSIGVDNIDARPISYYEKDSLFFKPFTLQLKKGIPNVLAYYKKGEEDKPIGTILFDPKTHKIVAWVIINQGGYYYYLLFNLL